MVDRAYEAMLRRIKLKPFVALNRISLINCSNNLNNSIVCTINLAVIKNDILVSRAGYDIIIQCTQNALCFIVLSQRISPL